MKSFVQIYALAVCFTTLMCFVVALGIGIYDAIQMSAPEFTLQYYGPYQSNEAFVGSFPDHKELPEKDIAQLRQRRLHDALIGEQRAAKQSVVFVIIVLIIDVAVFAAHWRLARTHPVPSSAPTGQC